MVDFVARSNQMTLGKPRLTDMSTSTPDSDRASALSLRGTRHPIVGLRRSTPAPARTYVLSRSDR